jgi:hypothetical protein
VTIADGLQFYPLFAGLIAVVFWLGVLSNRVRTLEREVGAMKAEEGPGGTGERLVRVEVLLAETRDSLKSMDRGLQGVQRQLGNLVTKGADFGAHA